MRPVLSYPNVRPNPYLTDTGLCGAWRAMRFLTLEFLWKKRSGVERGTERNVHERNKQSCGELFFGPSSVNRAYLNLWILGSKTKVIFYEKILNWVLSPMLISQKTILTLRVQRWNWLLELSNRYHKNVIPYHKL